MISIEDWHDPYPSPVVELYDTRRKGKVQVVRDDLLEGGSKVRFIDYLIGHDPDNAHVTEWVFGGSNKIGWGPISLSYVCAKYGKRATFFMAKRARPTPHQQRVLDLGGKIIWVDFGMLTVTLSRARNYVEDAPQFRKELPLGLEHASVIASIVKVARDIKWPIEPTEIWSVGSSGTLNRGLQAAFPNLPATVIQTGHEMTTKEIGRAERLKSPYKFDQPVIAGEAPPFPSALEYDAKAWKWVKSYAKNGAIFWNVAGIIQETTNS